MDRNAIAERSRQRTFLDREEITQKRRIYCALRRGQDIVLSAGALLVLWPFMLLTAVVILLDSPGASPIFVQDRVGKDGKRFRFYKFRSMIPDAEDYLEELLNQNEADGPAFKMQHDPRITKVGRILRKTSIDELPQFFNVLKGDMSIVGPRPPLPREVEKYDEYQRQRLYVTPGLTCYWQIQPFRNELSFDEWMELDIQYIANRSFLNDWAIILKTFGAVLDMNGV